MRRMIFAAILVLGHTLPLSSAAETLPPPSSPPQVPTATPAGHAADVRTRAALEIAWWHFREGRYDRALNLFDELMGTAASPSLRWEAQWGKALCLDRLQKRDEAAALILDLDRQGYRTKDTKRWLDGYRRSRSVTPRVSFQMELRKEAASVAIDEDPRVLTRFVRRNANALRRCIAPEAFLEVAKALRQKGQNEEARHVLQRVLDCAAHRYDLRLGVYYELMELDSHEDMTRTIEMEKVRPGLPASYLTGLETLKMEVLRRQLRTLPEQAQETETIAGFILEKDPDDPEALLKLGWFYFRTGRFLEAESLFARCRRARPDRQDATLGLAHTLISLGRFRDAENLLNALTPPYPEGRQSALFRLHMEEGAFFSKEKDLAKAEASYRRAASIEPDDDAPWRSLGWLLLHQGRASQAAEAFRRASAAYPTSEEAQGLLLSLERSGQFSAAYDYAGQLNRTDDPELQQIVAEHYQRTGKVLHAASVAKDEKNDLIPWTTAGISYESRSGDKGTSRKKTLRLPWNLYLPSNPGSLWTLQMEGIHLDTGHPGSNPFVGSFGLLPGRKVSTSHWITSESVASPALGFSREGAWNVQVSAGLSPFGGPVDPMPVFTLEMRNPRWRLEAHQRSVEDSILSWIGQRDPYSDRTWGRVLQTGGSVSWQQSWPRGSWFNIRLGADHYWGKDVWPNFSISGDAALGSTFTHPSGTLSIGGFISATHYDRNSDFYTLGHGGYFSPSIFFMAGPTVRFLKEKHPMWRLDVETAAGYLYFENDSSPVYPRDDRPERYSGDRYSGPGWSGSLRAMRFLAPRWVVGAYVDADKTSDYTRWSTRVSLTWFFEERAGFGHVAPWFDEQLRSRGR